METAAKNITDIQKALLQPKQLKGENIVNQLSGKKMNNRKQKVQKQEKHFKPGNQGNSERQYECYRCGGEDHYSNECKFKEEFCKYCHLKGHIVKMCRRRQHSKKHNHSANAVDEDHSHQVDDYDSDCAQEYGLYFVSDTSTPVQAYTVDLEVNNKSLQLQLHIGATYSIITKKTPETS